MLLLCFLDKSPLDKVKRTLKMEKKKKKEHGSRRKAKTKKRKEYYQRKRHTVKGRRKRENAWLKHSREPEFYTMRLTTAWESEKNPSSPLLVRKTKNGKIAFSPFSRSPALPRSYLQSDRHASGQPPFARSCMLKTR